MSEFDLKQDYHSSASRVQQDNVLNQSGSNVGDAGASANAGPTLPPDWAWICCDQDHGSPSRIVANRDTASDPMVSATPSPTLNPSHQPRPHQEQLMNYHHVRTESGSSFPSPTAFNFSQGQARPNGHTHMHAHAKGHQGRPKVGSNRSSDFSASDSPLARAGSTPVVGIDYQGGSMKRGNRDRRSGLAKSLSIAVPGPWQQYNGGSATSSPILQGIASKPGSRASIPGGIDSSSQAHGSQAEQAFNIGQSYPSACAVGQESSSSDPIIVGIPGVGSMHPAPTEALLAQWMTYCCDKDDCQDPFPPQSTGPTTPASGFGASNGNFDDSQQGATGMFSQWLSGPNSMAVDLSSNVQSQPALEPYCCGGGPDCHEPIIDSIGCEGHPQSCGLPECCPPQAMSMGAQANDSNKESLDLFMKGVNWECLDADCMALHSFLPQDPSVTSGSRTPMTLASGTQASNTPQGAFSAQPSPYIGGTTQGSQLQQQEFDLGSSARSTDQQLEAFLAAVAKGDFFAGESGLTSTSLNAVISHDASGMTNEATIAPNPHVCHWQNCHSDFATVQELLSHVSSEHLKIKPNRNQPEAAPVYQFGLTSTGNGDQVGSRPESSTNGTKLQASLISNAGVPPFSALAEQFSMSTFANASTARGDYAEPGTTSALKKDGLMACLWDDCIPGPTPGSTARPFTGAFAQSTSAAAPGYQSHDFAKELESLRPLSQNTSAIRDPNEANMHPATAASHVHKVCRAPVPVQNDNPLDSASAVLKHLLEQHLGTDATNSLLNIAQNHYTSISASQLDKARGSIDSVSSAFKSSPMVPPPRKPNQAEGRRDSALDTPPSRPSDAKDEPVVFRCRWHGCEKEFEDNTSLTDHISNVHVGRGKSKYECLWEGCVRCDTECDSCDEGDRMDVEGTEKRGRKFATRQKVLRHIQSHTGYRPFVCHLCGQSVSEQATLNAHLRRHAEEKPFKCDEEDCDKAFASAASLAVHKRAHTGTKHHVCPHCGRGFIELSNLTKHIRTHTGDKPFSCPRSGCGRAFCRSDQLKRHMATCRYRRSSEDGQFSTTPSE